MKNIYEIYNRAKKVASMLAALPPVTSEAEADAQADVLARFTESQKACWSKCCGCTYPSDETWRDLVLEARVRKPVAVDAIRRRFA